jgi:hypothetical protein
MTSDSTETPSVHPGPSKSLLRLVKVLGLVMALLFLALIGGIIWKATHKPAPDVRDVVFDLGVDPASIRHLAVDGNTLAIATEREILVIDVAKRKIIMRSNKP